MTGSLSGIDIMELEDAVQELWKHGIYAESGMGCTGPIVMVNEEKSEKGHRGFEGCRLCCRRTGRLLELNSINCLKQQRTPL